MGEFYDLISIVKTDKPIEKIIDLGCGTGELTQVLHKRLQAKESIGTDNSPAMVAKAQTFVAPDLHVFEEDLQAFKANAGSTSCSKLLEHFRSEVAGGQAECFQNNYNKSTESLASETKGIFYSVNAKNKC